MRAILFICFMLWVTTAVAQPAPDSTDLSRPIAVVLGKTIRLADLQPDSITLKLYRYENEKRPQPYDEWLARYQEHKIQGLINGPLLEKYRASNNVRPTAEELAAYTVITRERNLIRLFKDMSQRQDIKARLGLSNLTENERIELKQQLEMVDKFVEVDQEMIQKDLECPKEADESYNEIGAFFITHHKTNKSLYERYGGSIIYQQLGPEPLDAYRKYFEEEQAKGAFQILDKRWEQPFWNYLTNDNMHVFCRDKKGFKCADLILTPPWQMEKLESGR